LQKEVKVLLVFLPILRLFIFITGGVRILGKSVNSNYMDSNDLQVGSLIYDWGGFNFHKRKIEVFDTTLRDGLQCPHVKKQPTLPEKIEFLENCCKLGIEAIELGFPVSSESHKNDVIELTRHATRNKLNIALSCLSRTRAEDVQAVIDASQKSGVEITVNLLIGSSKIRRLVENWDIKDMIGWITGSIKLAQDNNLPVEFVTEDGTRTDPKTLKKIYGAAIAMGVKRIWIADTVGETTPNSAKKITEFFKKEIIGKKKVKLDWHGHDDKGLGVANALAAAEAGADRIQVTALGMGERAGNTSAEPVVVNLNMAKANNYNLKDLHSYSQSASKMFGVSIRDNYPVIGSLVHATAAGMHAAAINKARKSKRKDLEGLVYSPFHPEDFGRETLIVVGPMSGSANVEWNLNELGLKVTDEIIGRILSVAKKEKKYLVKEDIRKILQEK
jgi:isopropylmalate/homocitrate/citramalate synthase